MQTRVRGEGGAARDADDRLRGAAPPDPRQGGDRAPPAASPATGPPAPPARPARARWRWRSPARRCFAGPDRRRGQPGPRRSRRSPPELARKRRAGEIAHTTGVVSITPQTGRQIAARRDRRPPARRDRARAGATRRRRPVRRAAPTSPSSRRGSRRPRAGRSSCRATVSTSVDLRLLQAVGQAPPTVVATLTGQMTPLTYRGRLVDRAERHRDVVHARLRPGADRAAAS